MNHPVNHADLALALYETACESHKRQDWRLACHALAKSLKQSLASSAAMPAPAPAPVVQVAAPVTVKAKAKAPAKAGKVRASQSFDMSAGGLVRALKMVCSVVETRNTIPITEHCKLIASENTLRLVGTDLDLEIVATVEAPGIGEWTATAKARDLMARLSAIPASHLVELAPGESYALKITAPGHAFNMPGLNPEDFPALNPCATSGPPASFHLDDADIRDGLAHVFDAISREETRYYLNGAYLHLAKRDGVDVLRLAATDGHRLSVWDIDAPDTGTSNPAPLVPAPGDSGKSPGGALIPYKAVKLLQKIAPYDVLVRFGVYDGGVVAQAGPLVMTTKLIDGSFPDYARVIPRKNTNKAHFDAPAMLDALKIFPRKEGAVRMLWTREGVALSQRDSETGEVIETSFAACSYKGAPLEIGFKLSYLRDALSLYDSDVILALADPEPEPGEDAAKAKSLAVHSPCIITPAKPCPRTHRLNVLMPLRV